MRIELVGCVFQGMLINLKLKTKVLTELILEKNIFAKEKISIMFIIYPVNKSFMYNGIIERYIKIDFLIDGRSITLIKYSNQFLYLKVL